MEETTIFAAVVDRRMEAKLRRVELGLAQWEVARKADVPPSAVSYLECGRYVPPSWERAIRTALGLEACDA